MHWQIDTRKGHVLLQRVFTSSKFSVEYRAWQWFYIVQGSGGLECSIGNSDGTQASLGAVDFGTGVYDVVANPETVTSPDGSQTHYTYGSTYDAVTSPDGETTRYYHDTTNPDRVTKIEPQISGANHTDIAYVSGGEAGGKIESVTVEDGSNNSLSEVDYSYNEDGTLDTATKGSLQAKYEYDTEDNMITVTQRSANNHSIVFSVTEYHYGGGTTTTGDQPESDRVWVTRKNPSDSNKDQKTVYTYYTEGGGADYRRTYLKSVTDPAGAVTQ